MATAKERFKKQNSVSVNEKVATARKKQPELDIKTPETTSDLATTETVIPTTVVSENQSLNTDFHIASTAAITNKVEGIYTAANTALEQIGETAITSFSSVTENLNLILSRDVTVDQLAQKLGTLSWEDRNAQLATLDEVENFQRVQIRKQEIQETQIGIELKEIGLKLKLAKGMLKNAITVEEVKDLESQLQTVQAENKLKQDGRNIQLSFIAGKNAVDQSRVANRLSYLAGQDQRLTGQENDRLTHTDQMSELHRQLYAATQKGYQAYVDSKVIKADAKAKLTDRMKAESK